MTDTSLRAERHYRSCDNRIIGKLNKSDPGTAPGSDFFWPDRIHAIMRIALTNSILSIVFVISCVSAGRCEIEVFDRVTTIRTPVRIAVLTRGRLFAKGGERVDIYVAGIHLKQILTGGDGYGYLSYTPQDPGLKNVTARSNGDTATGLLLVMRPTEKAVIIEIEEGFKDNILSAEARTRIRNAVNSLSKNYKIIYLGKYIGKGIGRGWLEKENFPESVILPWRGTQVFAALTEKGVRLHAVIGSAAVISAAKKYVEHRYTFEETTDGKTVTDWDEILKLLQ